MNVKTNPEPEIEKPAAPTSPPAAPVAVIPKREQIVVSSDVMILDTGVFEQMQRIANLMASTSLVPAHLNRFTKISGQEITMSREEAIANCFLVVDQAVRWGMDPFAVAQSTFVTQGRLGFEGKLIAAVINTRPRLQKRLEYRYFGERGTKERGVTVVGRVAGDDKDREIEGTVADWATKNEQWGRAPDQMLAYRGAREWARRWMPEAILGVISEEEVETISAPPSPPQAEPPKRGTAALVSAMKSSAATHAPALVEERDARDEELRKLETETRAPAEPGITDEEVRQLRISDWCAKVDEFATREALERWAAGEQVPQDIRDTPDFAKAFAKRLTHLKDLKPK